MKNFDIATWHKGPIIAIAACLILAGAVFYRLTVQEDGAAADIAAETADGAMSTPVSLDQLRANAENAPDDVAAWQELGFAYFTSNMFSEAAEAYAHATEIAPNVAVLWSSLGEARVMASEVEPMPQSAVQAFRRALELDSGDQRARYFMAVEKDLAGDHEGAIAGWLALLADTPPGAPWETDLVRTIEQVGELRDIPVSDRIDQAAATRNILPASVVPAIPGPTQEQLAAASSIAPSEQQNMAEAMVARLAARMESEPDNVDGWIMLMRSYRTLDRNEDAERAYRRALAANPQARTQLQAAAESLGI